MGSVAALVVVYTVAAAVVVVGFTGKLVMGVYARLLFRLDGLQHRRRMQHLRRVLIDADRTDRAYEDVCWNMLREPYAVKARRLMAERHARHLDELVDEVNTARRARLVADIERPKLKVVG